MSDHGETRKVLWFERSARISRAQELENEVEKLLKLVAEKQELAADNRRRALEIQTAAEILGALDEKENPHPNWLQGDGETIREWREGDEKLVRGGLTQDEHTVARHLKGCVERRELPTWQEIQMAADALLSRHTGTFSQDQRDR